MSALQASAQVQLRQIVESLERLGEEKKALSGDITDKFTEAKAMGFDPKIIRLVLKIRKQSKAEREEEDAILAIYLHALGMEGTPLDDWRIEQEAKASSTRESRPGA
jgi:uncharacterized protein (UPF0335 family)